MVENVKKVIEDLWTNLAVSDSAPLDMERLISGVERCAEALEELSSQREQEQAVPSDSDVRLLERRTILGYVAQRFGANEADRAAQELPPLPGTDFIMRVRQYRLTHPGTLAEAVEVIREQDRIGRALGEVMGHAAANARQAALTLQEDRTLWHRTAGHQAPEDGPEQPERLATDVSPNEFLGDSNDE